MVLLVNRMHDHEVEQAQVAWGQAPEEGRADYKESPRRHLSAGGASLVANGQPMSRPQNRGAAWAAECRVDGILVWLLNETGVAKVVPGKLWEGTALHRPATGKARPCSVESPSVGFIVGGTNLICSRPLRTTYADCASVRRSVSGNLLGGPFCPLAKWSVPHEDVQAQRTWWACPEAVDCRMASIRSPSAMGSVAPSLTGCFCQCACWM